MLFLPFLYSCVHANITRKSKEEGYGFPDGERLEFCCLKTLLYTAL